MYWTFRGVDNADLYVGGLLETHLTGAAVGKTIGHIIALQFKNSMFGDRYFYNHNNVDAAHMFTDGKFNYKREL